MIMHVSRSTRQRPLPGHRAVFGSRAGQRRAPHVCRVQRRPHGPLRNSPSTAFGDVEIPLLLISPRAYAARSGGRDHEFRLDRPFVDLTDSMTAADPPSTRQQRRTSTTLPDNTASNGELIEIALAGGSRGSTAWSILVRRLAPAVWKALWNVRLADEDREDAFQATWLRALERLHQVREPAKVHVWLMVIATNEGFAAAERRRRLTPTDEPLDGSTNPDFQATVEHDERRTTARRAIAELEPETQKLLRLLSVDPPLSYAEIDQIMGWPSGGAAVRRFRAIKKLQTMPAIHRLMNANDHDGPRQP